MKTIFEFVGSDMGNGGAETLVKDYAIFLSKKGFRVIVVAQYPLSETSGNLQHLKNEGIEVFSLLQKKDLNKSFFAQKLWNHFLLQRVMKQRLSTLIDQYNPDVIHAHLNVLGTLLKVSDKLNNTKLLYTCHNHPEVHLKTTDKTDELGAARKLIINNHLQMIALHEEMKDELNNMFGIDNTKIIWNGVNIKKFTSCIETKEDIRKDLGIPQNAFVVCHVGSFSKAKNHPFIVEIFKQVCQKNESALLLLVGNGNPNPTINLLDSAGLKGKYLILSGRSDVERMLKASDVFLFPSLYEGLPVSLVEAQVAGLRCVVSDRITESCFLLSTTVVKSLDDTAEQWAGTVLDDSLRGPYNKDISQFDMDNVIDELAKLYLS